VFTKEAEGKKVQDVKPAEKKNSGNKVLERWHIPERGGAPEKMQNQVRQWLTPATPMQSKKSTNPKGGETGRLAKTKQKKSGKETGRKKEAFERKRGRLILRRTG